MSQDRSRFILSICIATRNGGDFLFGAVESIVSQAQFSENPVQIVVSDNHSRISARVILFPRFDQYKESIKIVEPPSVLIADENFLYALRHGDGKFLKLFNDGFKLLPDSLGELINFVKIASSEERPYPHLHFPTKSSGKVGFLRYSLEDYLKEVSYWPAYMNTFSVWKEDLPIYLELNCAESYRIRHYIYALAKVASDGAYIYGKPLYHPIRRLKTGVRDLNIFRTFLTEPRKALEPYMRGGVVSRKTIRALMRGALWRLVLVTDLKSTARLNMQYGLEDRVRIISSEVGVFNCILYLMSFFSLLPVVFAIRFWGLLFPSSSIVMSRGTGDND